MQIKNSVLGAIPPLIIYTKQGRFQKKIKGSSFVGVAATPLKPHPSCYRVKRRGD